MSLVTAAENLVRKVKGERWDARHPQDWTAPGLVLLDDAPAAAVRARAPGPVDVAAECGAWEEGRPYVDDAWAPGRPPRWASRGGAGWYEDPILDITLVNRSGSVTLISRIGIEAIGANHRAYDGLGGGAAEAVGLHRTYQLPLPDLWRTLAEGHRVGPSPGAGMPMRQSHALPWVATTERSSIRLSDPVLVATDRAYRFGLHLFDYVNFCPPRSSS